MSLQDGANYLWTAADEIDEALHAMLADIDEHIDEIVDAGDTDDAVTLQEERDELEAAAEDIKAEARSLGHRLEALYQEYRHLTY